MERKIVQTMSSKEKPASTRIRRALYLGGMILGVAGGSIFVGSRCGVDAVEAMPGKGPARPVSTYTIEGYANTREQTYLGRVRAPKEIRLAFEVGGRVDMLEVPTGSRVSAGTLLARLDSTQFELTLESAEAQLLFTEKDLTRTQRLSATGSAAVSELDRANSAEALSRIAVEMAREQLSNTQLHAPFDGRIARRLVERGSFVGAGDPIFIFQENGPGEVDFYQTESQLNGLLAKLESEQIAIMVADGPARGSELMLRDYATTPDPHTGAYRVTMRIKGTVPVNLFPGTPLRLAVRERIADEEGIVQVPANALVGDVQGHHHVWLLPQGEQQPVLREVVVGQVGHPFIEVLSGLAPGDRIVTAGASLLHTDSRVIAQKES